MRVEVPSSLSSLAAALGPVGGAVLGASLIIVGVIVLLNPIIVAWVVGVSMILAAVGIITATLIRPNYPGSPNSLAAGDEQAESWERSNVGPRAMSR
jgi:hypothetical protein